MKKARVVIVGGGFGGLSAAKALKNENLQVTLVDKRNYHLFQPLLYQVASAALSPADIAYPLRGLLGHLPNVEILLGDVKEINKTQKWIKTDSNQIDYDYLILACGSTYTYFGNPQWEKFAPSLKTITQATEIRRKVFLAFEQAEREPDPGKRVPYLTFVVVGGGPTGVELAGSLGEITRYTITKDFEHISPDQTRIILVEMGKKILPSMTDALSREAVRELQELGVEVRVNTKVEDINERGITVNGEFIACATVLWGAGVGASPLNKTLDVELDKQGRIVVSRTLNIPSFPEIFVIGDQARYEWGPDRTPLPGLAPVAMQEGRFVADFIKRKLSGSSLPEFFKYTDKGQMATIGRSRAVALYKGLEMHGIIAWLGWLFVHIYYLIGFKNRLFVLFQWAWTYLTFRRGARLIVEKE
jgi:NADH:ubiquinone reductase (H+-translocating)